MEQSECDRGRGFKGLTQHTNTPHTDKHRDRLRLRCVPNSLAQKLQVQTYCNSDADLRRVSEDRIIYVNRVDLKLFMGLGRPRKARRSKLIGGKGDS